MAGQSGTKSQSQTKSERGKRVTTLGRGVVRASKLGIGRAALKGLARRAGVRKLGTPIMAQFRAAGIQFITQVIKNSIAFSEAAQRKSIQLLDVLHALRAIGRPVYGYGL